MNTSVRRVIANIVYFISFILIEVTLNTMRAKVCTTQRSKIKCRK